MRYRDKSFVKIQDKQRNSDIYDPIPDRRRRRESEKRYSTFYSKRLFNLIDKYWWNNLSDFDRDKIITLYSAQNLYLSEGIIKNGIKIFDKWQDWVSYVKETFKPDMVKLREDKFKALGI
jgi:hypothetical protein